MKKIIFILLFYIFSGELCAQVTFMRTYGDTNWDRAHTIPTYDKGFATFCDKDQNFQSPKIDLLLFKIDSMGDTLWTKIYRGAHGGYGPIDFVQTPDSGFILSGMLLDSGRSPTVHEVLIKTDKNGDTLWTRAGVGTGNVIETVDKGYAIFFAGRLTKVDSNGNFQWRKTYPDHVGGGDLIQTNDSGYIMCGTTSAFATGGPNDNDFYVVKTDPVGNVQWAKAYGGPLPEGSVTIQQTFAGDYVILGSTRSYGLGSTDILLLKMDPAGDTLWSTVMGGIFDDYGYGLEQTFGSVGYVVTGTTPGFETDSGSWGNYRSYMIKTDYNGNYLWAQRYGLGTNDYFSWVFRTWDNGFMLSGATGNWAVGNTDAWLVKTDANGNSGCYNVPTYPGITKPVLNITPGNMNCIISTTPFYNIPIDVISDLRLTPNIACTSDTNWLGVVEVRSQTSISIYPNPANELLNIDLRDVKDATGFEIYNSLGQFIYSQKTTNAQNAIDVSAYPAGIYLLRVLTSKNHAHTIRFVKEL